MNSEAAFRHLPAIEKILQHPRLESLRDRLALPILADCARRAVADLREHWRRSAPAPVDLDAALARAIDLTIAQAARLLQPSLKRVINATGVILHTGLGRAALSEAARMALLDSLTGYCSLEIDLATGKRGDRHVHVAQLVQALTGAAAACVVNNNAAAVLLTLNSIANKKEIIVSRGQLVEIGGSFRMPEVIKKSGAKLVEVGTTNKTKLADYAQAITPRTAGFLVAHTSNYRILGFTHEVEIRELAALARVHNLIVVHDLGGGVLVDLRLWGLPPEPVVSASIAAGVHLVTFSGDKVLGGPQSGLIAGEAELIQRIKKNPLMRALRCDKLTLGVLEHTLRLFLQPEALPQRHEVLRSMTEELRFVHERAQRLQVEVQRSCNAWLVAEVVRSESEAGSGALPLEKIPSHAVRLRAVACSSSALARLLRLQELPVLAYVREACVWLDCRTILEREIPLVVQALQTAGRILAEPGSRRAKK